ncbi:hypothetical protein [Variovorax paradoxus]|uniref:hypothetical protein n=1 Tax=Variovorax paradoxus TaxID=34073 RepID=UPI003ECF22BB
MFQSRMTLVTAALAAMLPCMAVAQGLKPNQPPKDFCPLGQKIGLPTGRVSEDGCSSAPYVASPTPGRNGLNNTLAFYSLSEPGKETELLYISLMLNVNNPAEAEIANKMLVTAAEGLAGQVLGKVPPGLVEATRKSRNGTWKSGGWNVEVNRKEWNTSSGGHQVTVRFRAAN